MNALVPTWFGEKRIGRKEEVFNNGTGTWGKAGKEAQFELGGRD